MSSIGLYIVRKCTHGLLVPGHSCAWNQEQWVKPDSCKEERAVCQRRSSRPSRVRERPDTSLAGNRSIAEKAFKLLSPWVGESARSWDHV